ncbi:hypothetical protein [Plantactinospora sp. GCM10030261]|uniref:hypothetical protein n=1 Tax=Plantactinospora sp. GCM10030261 TaxID=3273420 RepID=UPI00366B0A37
MYLHTEPVALPAALVPGSAAGIIPAAGVPSAPQAHQVSARRERLLVDPASGVQGTNGFAALDVPASKQGTDVRGVPPRGRPV